MQVKTVDLYEYFEKQRGGANGGYLTVYSRTPSREIKPKTRPSMLVVPGGGYGTRSVGVRVEGVLRVRIEVQHPHGVPRAADGSVYGGGVYPGERGRVLRG